jgi:hypothetical protein
MKRGVWEVLTWVFVLAAIYLLVRPGSLGPTIVGTVGDAVTNLVTFAVSS